MKKMIVDTHVGSQKWNAFLKVFKNIYELNDFGSNKKFSTPTAKDAFLPAIEGRISTIQDYWRVKETNENVVFASIQKGFIKSGSLWQLTAIIALAKGKDFFADFTESVPVHKLTDEIMEKEQSTRYKIMDTLYPNFEKIGLIPLLLPGETEENWLAEGIKNLKEKSNF